MARLDALPSIDIIHGFRGTLDFYLWKGLPCVRSWPRTPRSHLTPATLASAALFGAIIKGYSLLGDGALEAFREDAADQTRTARDIYVSGVYGHLHQRALPPPPPPPEEPMYDAYICVRDKKAPGTQGGTFTSAAWRTRDINDEHADTLDLCTIAANQITLNAGAYRCFISCPALMVHRHKARLYNITDAAELLIGTGEHAAVVALAQSCSFIKGRFTLDTLKVLEIHHWCETTQANQGFGVPGIVGDEIFTIAEFWREIEAE